MFLKQISVGGDRNFGYIVADETTKLAAIIDPSYSPEKVVKEAEENGFKIKYIFNTHKHSDHTNGNDAAEKLTGISPLAYGDIDAQTGIKIEDGAKFMLGKLEMHILYTPGHTEDCICNMSEMQYLPAIHFL
jgi:hydroxyacylglutathione hydrolase